MLNVDSPAFTPSLSPRPIKNQTLSPKVAAAASFTPRGSGALTPLGHVKLPSDDFASSQPFQLPQQTAEFVPPGQPQALAAYSDTLSPHGISMLDGQPFNAFAAPSPFMHDASFKHPLNYHLSAAVGPRRDHMQPYQRAAADFFVPDEVRETLLRKADASNQVFPNSGLPQQVEHFHSLVALDSNPRKTRSFFGLPSWLYKATSARDGHLYTLCRIQGFRLTDPRAISNFQAWKRVNSGTLVNVHDAFTGKWFGDSSLIVVTDYFPLSQSLADKYFASGRLSRTVTAPVAENVLWGYMVQLANALRAVHDVGLAAQTVTASKVLITSKNRLRLNGCGVLDILRFEKRPSVAELQRADLQDLGRLMLNLAARSPTADQEPEKSLRLIAATHSQRLQVTIGWLLVPPPGTERLDEYNVGSLLTSIADKMSSSLDSAFHHEDDTMNHLALELENGRLFRLQTKLNLIIERPESSPAGSNMPSSLLNHPSQSWSETGDRYVLKLFRDYVFHQVDHAGRPVINMAHIVSSLNKLDGALDEMVQLVSRDEQNVFAVSYRDLKRAMDGAWAELTKASAGNRR
ncbi:hypothetical protein K470DRAFT_75205 [Piedraia hortae CBS 480.64]|uniref:PAN2-PAN3 deadenylation complex subunit PAN3 n=1 Tax=Piedraia hortae CBS 480.64 TaxID=1314780 RepID=A0A6A7BYM3_9PEZI|nr:hypothetical protein K470DRAFT_75205 [Piedraia hortae CBS 480.64]